MMFPFDGFNAIPQMRRFAAVDVSRMDTKRGCSSTTELVVYLLLGARLTAFRVPAPHTPELPAHSKQHQP